MDLGVVVYYLDFRNFTDSTGVGDLVSETAGHHEARVLLSGHPDSWGSDELTCHVVDGGVDFSPMVEDSLSFTIQTWKQIPAQSMGPDHCAFLFLVLRHSVQAPLSDDLAFLRRTSVPDEVRIGSSVQGDLLRR